MHLYTWIRKVRLVLHVNDALTVAYTIKHICY